MSSIFTIQAIKKEQVARLQWYRDKINKSLSCKDKLCIEFEDGNYVLYYDNSSDKAIFVYETDVKGMNKYLNGFLTGHYLGSIDNEVNNDS